MSKGTRLFSVVVLLAALSMAAAVSAQKLVIWDYVPWRVPYYQQYADEYMKMHPGLEIEAQLVAQGEYVAKLVVSAITGTAPAMFAGHPVWIGDLADLLEPFPHDLFPPERLSEELLGYDALVHDDGNAYYYPLGMQGPMLFINQDLFDQAGVGAAPRTWEEAMSIGRRASRIVEGVTEVAGFYFYDDMMNDVFTDLIYQFGGRIYKDHKNVAFDAKPALEAMGLITDMYETGMTGNGNVGNFQSGVQVMRYGVAWRVQQIRTATDLRWTVAPLPTLTGEAHPDMSRMDYYLGLAVPVGNDPKTTRASFEFIDWMYNDEERVMALNSQSGTLPARYSTWTLPEITENPVLLQLTQTLPFGVFPGEYPQWIKDQLAPVRTAL